jgi:hypothetical protein
MSRAVSPSTNRFYGVLRVTQIWKTARATVYRRRRRDAPRPRRRPGPLGPMSDQAHGDPRVPKRQPIPR